MTSATKVFLAFFALLIGVLVLYYGVWQRADPATGISSASGASPAPSTVSRGQQPTEQGLGRLGRNGSTTSRIRVPAVIPGNSGLLTDALLHQPGATPSPPATDSSLDSLAAAETPASASRPAANTPVAIGTNNPTPAETGTAEPTLLASNTVTTPPGPTEPKPTGSVQPRGQQSLPGTSAASKSAEAEYTVKAGDTGTSIAKQWFGDPNKWILISKANPWVDFNRLRIGQKLKMPPKDATSVKPPAAQPVTMGDKTTYVVQAGDTLAGIARKQLGNAALWEQIYDANKTVIGSDPADLKVGMKLKLPDKSSAKRE